MQWAHEQNLHVINNFLEALHIFPNTGITGRGALQFVLGVVLFVNSNIYSVTQKKKHLFSFDTENDTTLTFATEMVDELDITEQDVTQH